MLRARGPSRNSMARDSRGAEVKAPLLPALIGGYRVARYAFTPPVVNE
jgi:hypothetical protein